MQADLVARPKLGRVISRLIGQHADHRIASGHWMIGEKDQRLPCCGNLDCATDQTLGR